MTITPIKKRCDICDKEFEGINEAQVNSQITTHKLYKHKIEIKEVKND